MIKISKPNIQAEDIERVLKVLQSGNLVHGSNCEQFEKDLASYLNITHTVLVSSGTAALYLALLALSIGKGHAVLVPNFTFPATINTVRLVGAEPILVDVCPTSYSISVDSVKTAIDSYQGTAEIKAIMPVHEFGYPVDIQALKTNYPHLYIIEDAACALGATHKHNKVGTQGDISCFSFHPRKVLTTGEGGLVASANPMIIERIKRLKNHGIEYNSKGVSFLEPGHNFRLTDFQAALGIGQLKKLDQWIEKRRHLARLYHEGLEKYVAMQWLRVPEFKLGHSWQSYMIVLEADVNRMKVIQDLKELGIETNIGAQCLSMIPSISKLCTTSELKVSQEIGLKGLALPMCEQYSEKQINQVIKSVAEVIRQQL